MPVILLAATLSVTQMLTLADAFCTNAEVEISRPLSEAMVSGLMVDPQHDRIQGMIQDRYRFGCYKGKVQEFADRKENVFARLGRSDPADKVKWSQEPCFITETQAMEMAARNFQKLGYDAKRFDAPEVARFRWIPAPANPNSFLLFPAFGVTYFRKGESHNNHVTSARIEFIISGTTKKLIYFFDASQLGGTLERMLTKAVPTPPEEQPSIGLKEAIRACEPMLKAIGAQINRPLEQHVELRLPSEQAKQMQGASARPFLIVNDRFLFEMSSGRLCEFNDLHERPITVLEVDNPQRIRDMAQEKFSLDEKRALQIALTIFHALGFRDRSFYPPKVSRHVNGTSPFFGLDPADFYWSEHPKHPATPLALPDSFRVKWVGNSLIDGLLGKEQDIIMEISGVTSNLIFYWHTP
jgi:hypothetical protein